MAINLVEWDQETIKKAEKACKEANQIVVIKTIDVSKVFGACFGIWC